MERWPSGLRRTPGKRVHRKVSGVRIPVSPPDPTPNYARNSGRFHAKERGAKRSFGDGQRSRKAGHPQGGRVVRCGVCAAPSGMRRLEAAFRQRTLPGVERPVVYNHSGPGAAIPVSPPDPTPNYARNSGRFHAKERGTKRSFGNGQQSRKAGHPQGGRVVRCGVCAATPSIHLHEPVHCAACASPIEQHHSINAFRQLSDHQRVMRRDDILFPHTPAGRIHYLQSGN